MVVFINLFVRLLKVVVINRKAIVFRILLIVLFIKVCFFCKLGIKNVMLKVNNVFSSV